MNGDLLREIITVFGDQLLEDDSTEMLIGAQFNIDFGPFKAGEEVNNLRVDWEEGFIQSLDDGRRCGIRVMIHQAGTYQPSKEEIDLVWNELGIVRMNDMSNEIILAARIVQMRLGYKR